MAPVALCALHRSASGVDEDAEPQGLSDVAGAVVLVRQSEDTVLVLWAVGPHAETGTDLHRGLPLGIKMCGRVLLQPLWTFLWVAGVVTCRPVADTHGMSEAARGAHSSPERSYWVAAGTRRCLLGSGAPRGSAGQAGPGRAPPTLAFQVLPLGSALDPQGLGEREKHAAWVPRFSCHRRELGRCRCT